MLFQSWCKSQRSVLTGSTPGLIQKEKVDIDGEKGAQISIVAKKIATQGQFEIMIMKYK